ncbi:MAG: hypothetical protein IJY65_05015 [Clostridia bacterium]|nr:hypothetical protein [Clostridia bacterium]
MFKLIKILNSGINVPELERIPAASGVSYTVGMAINASDGSAANCTATVAPTHISAQKLAAGEKEYVLCYPISRDMLFEAPVTASPASLAVGSKLTLALDESGRAYGVTATTTSGVATVVDLCGAASAGDKLTVKLA